MDPPWEGEFCFSDPRKTAGGILDWMHLEAVFFKEKDQEMAATPLKTNGCPLKIDGWKLEDVFPIEVYSPFLGDILVFQGVNNSIQRRIIVGRFNWFS